MYDVLYADNDERSRRMVCRYRFWQESGFSLKAKAASGEEALNLLKKEKFDLVITDLQMKAGEDLLLAEVMKQQNCRSALILSGSLCSFESAREGMRLGALDFIPKPVTERKLSEALERIEPELRKRKQQAQGALSGTVNEEEIEELYREIIAGKPDDEALEGRVRYLWGVLGETAGEEERGRRGAAILGELWIRLCRDYPWIERLNGGEWLEWRSWFRSDKRGAGEAVLCLKRMRRMAQSLRLVLVDETVNRILRSMAEKLSRADCLEAVANELELSKDYVSTMFKKRMGIGQNEYLTIMRMEYAGYLLKTTNLKVYQVAKRAGYSTSDYFSRLFKLYANMTPASYRREG